MKIEFDPEKSAKNDRERGLSFELAAELEWDRAVILQDRRQNYGEDRSLEHWQFKLNHIIVIPAQAGIQKTGCDR